MEVEAQAHNNKAGYIPTHDLQHLLGIHSVIDMRHTK
jgi:hypothetical protein